jgi:hypothetical protein
MQVSLVLRTLNIRIFVAKNRVNLYLFSLNELRFHYNKQLVFVSLSTFTCKVLQIFTL